MKYILTYGMLHIRLPARISIATSDHLKYFLAYDPNPVYGARIVGAPPHKPQPKTLGHGYDPQDR